MEKIFILYSIVLVYNIFAVFSFFNKLISVETKRWSTTLSTFQIIYLFPRTIGVFQIPLITLYTESAINSKEKIAITFYQGIILFNSFGLIIGTLLLPFFVKSLKEIILNIYAKDSFKNQFFQSLRNFFKLDNYATFFSEFKLFKFYDKKIFLNDTFSTYLMVIAFPACILAGYQIPAYRATIISLVSIIYGVSSTISVLYIETKISLLTDKSFHSQIELHHYKAMLFDCLKGKILGTLIGVITLPFVAEILVYIFKLIIRFS